MKLKVICVCLLSWAELSFAAHAAAEDYLACVSNERGDSISIISGSKLEVVATVPVGKRPRGIHASPDGKLLYVAVSGSPIAGPRLGRKGDDDDDDAKKVDHSADGIAIVDLSSFRVLKKINAGSDPEQFVVTPDGKRLYVANEDNVSLSIITAEDGTLEKSIPVGKEPEGVGLTPDGKRVFVTCETGGEVYVVDAAEKKVMSQFKVGPRPRNVMFMADGSRAYIPSEASGFVSVIDALNYKQLETIAFPTNSRPMGMALSHDGQSLYVSTGWAATVCVVNTADNKVQGTIKVGPRPWGIALSPDGKKLFVANGPSNDVSVVDVNERKEVSRIKTGQSPWGVAIVPRGVSSQ